ncbi:hypothetical protein [Treponema sp.]|uniref:hypothetical protein n=1 Tax=Treponema sp. TaxID=166 RepID=UPI00298E0878|nr:hypothetical protein [Treponema sp.]
MMNGKDKAILWFTIGAFVALCVSSAVFAGFDRHAERKADQRVSEYVERSENAESIADGIQQRAGKLEEQVLSVGIKTSECVVELRECVTELGGLQDDCDRIAEAGRGIAVSVDGIERRILVCLQILGVSEEDEELLDGYGLELYDPGGR